MSRESEADKIARMLRSQNEAREKIRQAEVVRREEPKRKDDTREIIEEIPRVLQLLADLGYPNTVDLEVEVKVPLLTLVSVFVSPYRRSIKAGWLIGEWSRRFYEGYTSVGIYLISNGYIAFGDIGGSNPAIFAVMCSPQELENPSFDDRRSLVLNGLVNLRQGLEGS